MPQGIQMLHLEKTNIKEVDHQENYSKIERSINNISDDYFIGITPSETGKFTIDTGLDINNTLSNSRDIEVLDINNGIITINVLKANVKYVIIASKKQNIINGELRNA